MALGDGSGEVTIAAELEKGHAVGSIACEGARAGQICSRPVHCRPHRRAAGVLSSGIVRYRHDSERQVNDLLS